MTILQDNNGRPFENIDTFAVVVSTPPAFTGATADSRGDFAGTLNPDTMFTVTGDVLVRIYGVCTTLLASAGAGTVSLGVSGNTALLIPASTATDIDANDIWFDATPTEVGGVALSSITGPFVIVNGLDIIETVGTADIETGNIYYVCLWRPLSRDGSVVSV